MVNFSNHWAVATQISMPFAIAMEKSAQPQAALSIPFIARQTRAGVAGPSKFLAPSGASASWIALWIAGKAATAPASPQPLTPSGLVVQRVGLKARLNAGRSA